MKKFLCVLGGASFVFNLFAQPIKPITIGDKVPNIAFDRVMNYSKTQFKLSDFKGKLVILDFFGTWCGACIPYIPKLDSLQKRLQDKIQIIVISEDPSNKVVNQFIKTKWNSKGDIIQLPFVLADSMTAGLFPHRMVPHEVWISPKGILTATTDATEVTLSNVNEALENPSMKLQQKVDQMDFNRELPLFVNKNGGAMVPLMKKSVLSHKIEGVASGAGYTIDSSNHLKRIYYINEPLFMIVQDASGYSKSRIMIKTKNSFKFIGDIKDSWLKDHLYCYELTVPDSTSKAKVHQFLLDDLRQNFGIHVQTEQKKLNGYVLQKMENPTTQKNGLSGYSSSQNSAVNILMSAIERFGFMPAVDATNDHTKANIWIPSHGIKDKSQLKEVLKVNGLVLRHARRKLKVIVLYNKTNH